MGQVTQLEPHVHLVLLWVAQPPLELWGEAVTRVLGHQMLGAYQIKLLDQRVVDQHLQ